MCVLAWSTNWSAAELEGEHTSTRTLGLAGGFCLSLPPLPLGCGCSATGESSSLSVSLSVRVLPVPKGPKSRNGVALCARLISASTTERC